MRNPGDLRARVRTSAEEQEETVEISRLFVLGGGTMGNGIAQVGAQGGYEVTLWDLDEGAVQKGLKAIDSSLDRMVKKEKLTPAERDQVRGRIRGTTRLEDAASSDLLIEAVVEDMGVKKDLFARLHGIAPAHAVFATNTSSLPVTEMAMASGRPDRFVGMHFFNPVPMMKLCEVIRTPRTGDAAVAAATEVATRMGKTPVKAKDTPGFLFNRLIIPYLNEAAWAVYEGVGSPEDIDTAMKLGGNMPIGPLALLDMIGIDVQEKVSDIFHKEFGDPKFRTCPLVRQMVRAGHLGRKTGKGFFEYPEAGAK